MDTAQFYREMIALEKGKYVQLRRIAEALEQILGEPSNITVPLDEE